MVEIIERGVSDEELVLFCFDVEDFDKGLIEIEWKEKNEFRSNGEMYDVVKKEIKGDSVYLHCVPDKKESFLYTVLENQSKSSHDKAKSLNIFKNLLSQFYFKPVENRNDSADNGTSEFLTYISSNPLKAEHLPETPPPRV